MAPHSLRKVLPFMHTLRTLKPAQRIILLEHLDTKSQAALYSALRKVINSKTTPIAHREKLKRILAPHKKSLRYLVDAKKPLRLKKKKLVQMGGQLGAVLGVAIPVLLDLLMKR